ncbi:MAG: MerC domain-containing protein [Limisphaerales bacterium]
MNTHTLSTIHDRGTGPRNGLRQEAGVDSSGQAVRARAPRWDRLGFVASSACAVHCVCLPWLLMAMPFLAGTCLADRKPL